MNGFQSAESWYALDMNWLFLLTLMLCEILLGSVPFLTFNINIIDIA